MFSSKYNDLKPTMKKLLLALLILLATSALAQQQDVAPLQISTNDQTSQKPVLKRQPTLIDEQKSDILSTENLSSKTLREQLPSDVQKALLDIEKNEIDRRVEYLQHQQTIFFSIFSVAAAIAIFGIGYFLSKNLGEKYRNKEQEMESRMKLLESTTAHRITNLDMQVALSEKSVEETRHKIDKAVDEAVNKAIERVHKKTEEKTEAFSTLVEERMKDIQKAHNEINLRKDNVTKDADEVSRLLKEIEESKGELTPKLQEEIKEQVEKTEKEKDESEYTAEDWFLKGVEAGKSGNNEKAVKYYEKAHYLDPKDENILYNWGTTLSRLNKCEAAIDKFEKAIERHEKGILTNPNAAIVYYNWGNVLVKLKRFEDAIDKFEKANKINDKDIDIYCNWGNALRELNKYEDAIDKFEKANKINKDDEDIYCNWGITFVKLKQYEKAIHKFKETIEIAHSFINPYKAWSLTLSLLRTSNPELYPAALQEFKDVLEKNKDIPELKDNEEFQKIYNEHFPTETPAEKPKTSPKKSKG